MLIHVDAVGGISLVQPQQRVLITVSGRVTVTRLEPATNPRDAREGVGASRENLGVRVEHLISVRWGHLPVTTSVRIACGRGAHTCHHVVQVVDALNEAFEPRIDRVVHVGSLLIVLTIERRRSRRIEVQSLTTSEAVGRLVVRLEREPIRPILNFNTSQRRHGHAEFIPQIGHRAEQVVGVLTQVEVVGQRVGHHPTEAEQLGTDDLPDEGRGCFRRLLAQSQHDVGHH